MHCKIEANGTLDPVTFTRQREEELRTEKCTRHHVIYPKAGVCGLCIDEQDAVNHPAHYNAHPSGIECIEITRHMGFNLGNAVKYIWRADEKGNTIEDLRKAIWYINDEIKKRESAK